MCTIFFAIDKHPTYPFIVAANRDEFYERETSPLQQWDDGTVGGRNQLSRPQSTGNQPRV